MYKMKRHSSLSLFITCDCAVDFYLLPNLNQILLL